ncbi:MAG: cold shock domain-containing protein [Saprospiraceae bacterium]|nr:cold shock domain-containing protein [Bacteroidia bacterium]NNE14124.1 cold shock domain-containing protein [Saprospiraceae bacterium]NNL90963.1 cold shock domain-containing protein [Saprospiraceae bacterium]
MAESFNKKDREKKKKKRKKDKAERREQRKSEGKTEIEFMYLDENGNLVPTPPDPMKKKVIKLEDINISVPKKEDIGEIDPIRNGKVKFFNTEKGYGFIDDIETRQSYFVHIDSLNEPITENDNVTFEIGNGPKGPIAFDVKLIK